MSRHLRRTGAAVAASVIILVSACAMPPGGGSPAASGGGTATEANDPIARSFVSDDAVLRGYNLFRRTMDEGGMLAVQRRMRSCERPAPSGRGDLGADVCMAFDFSQLVIGVAFERRQGIRMLDGLRPPDVERRKGAYFRALRVPPDQQRLVDNSVFQRVFALSTAAR